MYKYDKVEPIDKKESEIIFKSNDVDKICKAAVSIAFFEQDWLWAQNKFLELLLNENSDISGIAATCIGHIARIQGRIEKEKVIAILRSRISEQAICGQINDALDDIEMYVSVTNGMLH